MQWTKEQNRIINIQNSNILVSAAAGSGKTAVLVERIISLIKNEKIDIDKFLVITFTNAAATGMKQKIQRALVKSAKEDKNIRRQLGLINKAQITTIHSFCLDIIRKNFYSIGLDPSFRIGDTNEVNILLQEAIDEILERAYRDNHREFTNLVESFTSHRDDEDLNTIIMEIYKFLKSFPDPFNWLRDNVEKLNTTDEEFIKSIWYKEFEKHIKIQIDGARSIVNLALDICNKPDGPQAYTKTLNEDLDILNDLYKSIDKDYDLFMMELNSLKWPRLAPFKADKNPDVDIDKQLEVKDRLRKLYKDIIDDIKKSLYYEKLDEYVKDIGFMYEPMVVLKDLLMDLDEAYKEKKLNKAIVDFNDLEHYALSILEDENISKYYREKFKYIFVDEYQDSNSLQEAIISRIKGKDNLFMVGDVKQSIYRFRLADPDIFNYKYKTFEKDSDDLGADVINRVIELNKNFRSRKEILLGINYIFKKIMSLDMGEIDYDDNVSLVCGNENFINREKIELNIIDKGFIDQEQIGEIEYELNSMKDAEFEALFTINKIKELLKKETFDTKENKMRKIDYKDIVILLRSVANWSNIFEEKFNKENIPFYFDGGSGYFNTIEIQIIINLLKLLDNINQDIPLLSVMRSPIGKFTTDELTEIRMINPKDSYINSCLEYMDNESGVEEVKEKLRDFFNQIYLWRDKSIYMDLHDLIWKILIETEYYDFVGILPGGKTKQANLRLLTDKAYDFEKTSKGLFKFLTYIERLNMSQDNTSTAKTIGENDNVVRLMTVHSSKGLEFPIVFLCGLNKGFNLRDTYSKIMIHKDYGIGPKYINPTDRIEKNTLSRLAIVEKTKIENFSEEMRILYVAMTRAIDRLIMVGSVSSLDNGLKKWKLGYSKYFLYKGRSYLDWIGSCFFKDMDMEEVEEVLKNQAYDNWKINRIGTMDLFYEDQLLQDEVIEKINKLDEYNNKKYYDEIERRLSYKYPYKDSTKLPAKLAVTSLKNLKTEGFYRLPPLAEMIEYDKENRSFNIKKHRITGAEIGNLLHLIMENIDISKELDRNDLINQINEIGIKNQLSQLETNIILKNYVHKIEKFYNSDLGRRMKKSKIVKREVPFVIKKSIDEILDNSIEKENVLIQGIIDCYFEEDGQIVIVDYKTDGGNEDKIQEIKLEYKDQIDSYKEAIEKITNKKVKEAYLYLFSMEEVVKMD